MRFAWFLALPLIFVGAASGEVKERLASVHIPFIANAGQTDPTVAYYAPTFAGTVFVTWDGRIVYSLPGEKAAASNRSRVPCHRGGPCGRPPPVPPSQARNTGWSLTEKPVGGRAFPIGNQRALTNVSYFIGNDRSRWKSGLETFEGVSLGEVWPGIGLELRARGKNVEKLFTVAPGGDPSRIRMRVDGARSLRIDREKALVLGADFGKVTFTPPLAFQEQGGLRHPIQVAYWLRGKEYGFRLGDHDPRLPVLIDPLIQATYLGGGAYDAASAIAIHPASGDVYVAGSTTSTNFPGTTGGAQVTNRGFIAAFIARLNPSLTTITQATYLGGSDTNNGGIAIAIHPISGEVYVAGETISTDFPATVGGAQPANGGGWDTFVARLNSSLTTLAQATYLGGSTIDFPSALAIHPTSGAIYVAGYSRIASGFPGAVASEQRTKVGAFVARFNTTLTALDQTTYLGNEGDRAYALAIHPTSGEVYVAGQTGSADFPGIAGGAQVSLGGGFSYDAFVARLNDTLTVVNQATYLGGSGFDRALALAIHPASGEVYVAGLTGSMDCPRTVGGAQHASGLGGEDAFVARLNAALTTLNQATYLGGSSIDEASSIAIHPISGDVYIAGPTSSSNFPGTTAEAHPSNARGGDAFVARLNAALTALKQAVYLGGSAYDSAAALAIHPRSGDLYTAGETKSPDFPGTAGGAQTASSGDDAFIARLTADLAGECATDAATLCLNRGRFKVQTRWMTPDGLGGAGQAVGLTADTGYFSFFSPNNVEAIVKVVSGCGFNSRVWTFAAGLPTSTLC